MMNWQKLTPENVPETGRLVLARYGSETWPELLDCNPDADISERYSLDICDFDEETPDEVYDLLESYGYSHWCYIDEPEDV